MAKKKKKKYAMMKLNVPKRVTFPNGRTFVARYKRIPRDQLLLNMVMRRTYTKRTAPRASRSRRAQQWQGIFALIKNVAKNPLVKSVARRGLKYAPAAYANLTKRMKNKILKRILDSDMVHSTLNRAIRTANNLLRWVRD